MDKLQILYERIDALRGEGIKMKEIAEWVGLAPSILSSLYTTVLPAYLQRRKGEEDEEALDYSLSLVNNLSRRRLQTLLPAMLNALEAFESPTEAEPLAIPFLLRMGQAAQSSVNKASDILGTYLAYSLSSEGDLLKEEPLRLSSCREGLLAERLSAHGDFQRGFAMMGDPQNLYVYLDEAEEAEVMPITIYLQIPLFHHPRQLRGVYIGLDYNRNPIARRLVLLRQEADNSVSLDNLPHGLLSPDMLPEQLLPYYIYVGGKENTLRMCTIPALRMDASDLERERKMLEI